MKILRHISKPNPVVLLTEILIMKNWERVCSLHNTHASTETHLYSRLSVNKHLLRCYWKASYRDVCTEESLISKCCFSFLEDELPVLLHVPLHIRRELWLQQGTSSPHFGVQATVLLSQHFQNHWIGR